MNRFGEKLRILREQHGFSLRDLGEMLVVSKNHVWNIEQGRKTPNIAMLIKIADIFGVTTDQLVRDELELDGYKHKAKQITWE